MDIGDSHGRSICDGVLPVSEHVLSILLGMSLSN